MAGLRRFGPHRFVTSGIFARRRPGAHEPASPREKEPSDNLPLRTQNRRSRLAAMTAQDELSPSHAADHPPAPPETARSAEAATAPGPVPSPAAAPPTREAAGRAAPSGPPPGSLLGPLTVPDGAAHAAELEELSRRAYRSGLAKLRGLVPQPRP
jgi:hypothetical protein